MNPETLKRRYLREDEEALNNAVVAMLQHRETRMFLWWLLTIGRVGTQPYTRNALDTAFGCGELNVGQQIFNRILSVSPEGYVEMSKEMADARRTRDDELRDAGGDYSSDESGDGE